MEAKLIVIGGKANKSEVKLKLPTVIGRSRSADLTVAHPKVSRHHCQLFERDGLLHVRDNGSLNGTFIDSARVTEGVLKPGDKLTVGPLTFVAVYEPGAAGDSPPLPPAAASAQNTGKKTKAVRTERGAPSVVSPDLPTPAPGDLPIPAVAAGAKTNLSKPPKKPLAAVDHDESMVVDVVPDDSDMSSTPAHLHDDSPKAKAGGKIEWLPDVRSDQDDAGSDPGADTVDFSRRKSAGQGQASDVRKAPALNLAPPGKSAPAKPSPPAPPAIKKKNPADNEPAGTEQYVPVVNPSRPGKASKVSDDDALSWLEDDATPQAPAAKDKQPRAPADGATVQFASPMQAQDQGFALAAGVEQAPARPETAEKPSSEDDDLSAFFKTLED